MFRNAWIVAAAMLALGSKAYAQEDLSDEAIRIEAEYARSAMNTAFGFGSLWIANGFKVARLNAGTGEFLEIDLDGASQKQRKIAIGEGAVWVPDVGANLVFKIDPASNEVIASFPVDMLSTQGSIAIGAGSVWIVSAEGFEKTLVRLDSESGKEQASIELPNAGVGVAFGFGSAWVTSGMGDALYRIDADSNALMAQIAVGDGPLFLAAGEDSLWVHIQSDASIVRVDGTSSKVIAKIDTGLPSGVADIEIGGGYLWINTPYTVSLAQIDPNTNALIRKFSGAQGADALDYGDDSLWISARTIKRVTPPR